MKLRIRPKAVCRELARDAGGFTVPELIVVMTLTLLFSALVFSFAFDFWGNTGTLQNSNDTLVTRQNLGDSLRNRLNVASSLLNQNSIGDANVLAESPELEHWPFMHAVPKEIMMPAAGSYTAVLYFEAPSVDANKDFIMRGAMPYQDEYVLYLDGTRKSLMIRSLSNEEMDNPLRSSCPPESETPDCPADRVLAEDVSAVSLRYFSKSGNDIDHNNVLDPETGEPIGPDFPDVEVVELTISLEKRSQFKRLDNSSSQTTVRVALRNG